jgi:two-component system, cell cycle sensor histidine kinase and response regulator CckA
MTSAPVAFLLPVLCLLSVVILGSLLLAYHRQNARLREAQSSLAESQEHLRLIFEHSGVGMALLNPEGRFLQANPALRRLFGYNSAELAGRRLPDLAFPDDVGTGSSESDLGQNVPTSIYERERRYRHKDGQEIWARVLRVPLRDAARELRYLVAVIEDITERRRAQAALHRAEESLRRERDFVARVLETADALIVVLDHAGRILRFNGKCSAVSGYQEEEARGQVFWELAVPAPFRDTVRNGLAQCCNQQVPVGLEIPWLSLGGEERLIAWRFTTAVDTPAAGSRHHSTQEQPALVIAAGLDITDQKKLQDQLRHVQKMETLGTLVGGIAHDFNNQLTIVLGNIRLVLSKLAAGTREWSELADAEQAGQRCADMTQGLLTFSQRRLGELARTDPRQVVRESVRLLQRVVPPAITVISEPADDTWPVNADRTQLHQLLMNLALNGRDAMTEGGTLTVATSNQVVDERDCVGNVEWRPGRFVVLTVADTGTGMTPEIASRIFEPFFTTKKPGQGTGLGLAMVFGIVKAHRGWITVTTGPGQGSIFRVYLPAAEALAAGNQHQSHPLVRGGHETILVVDDEELIRRLARTILERWGFRVFTAEDGEQALILYQQHAAEIDLVLLDYTMPGLSGLDVLRELQRTEPEICVVFSSGHTLESNAEELLAAGARAYIPKPYKPEELVARLREVLDNDPRLAAQEACLAGQ